MRLPAIGDCIRLVINQNRRDCIVVEVLAEYVLAVYTMPAGRGTLTRIPHDRKPGRYDRQFWNASKAERQRHAKAILEAELERNFEREDEAENMRSGWKQRLKIKEILEQRAEIQRHLDGLKEIAETPAAPTAINTIFSAQEACTAIGAAPSYSHALAIYNKAHKSCTIRTGQDMLHKAILSRPDAPGRAMFTGPKP
jgi:hypothetical protein